jgi:hypothetical protein
MQQHTVLVMDGGGGASKIYARRSASTLSLVDLFLSLESD